MPGARLRRKHRFALKLQIARLFKRDRLYPREPELLRSSNLSDRRLNDGRVDGCRLVTGQAQQYGTVCTMAHPGQGKRSKKLRPDADDLLKFSFRFESARKAARCAHWPHGVRTRRSNAQFV